MNFRPFLSLIFLLIVIYACQSNPLDVKISKSSLGIKFINLDSIFVKSSQAEIVPALLKLKINRDEILSYELGHCLQLVDLSDSMTSLGIQKFVTDPYIARLEKRIEEKFKNLEASKTKLIEGFLHLDYHFPAGKKPKNIIFLNTLFASNVFCTENEIGIGLERYLGPQTDVIQELPSQEFFQWIKDGMRPEFMERDVLTAWIITHYVKESSENTADAIVNWGKIIYLTEAAFPQEEKSWIMRYSKEDYAWALENEYSLWKYLVDEKILFSKNEREQANLLHDGPFTIGLPEKGPDRLGQFLGWRMVQSYMEQFPDTKLEDLIKLPYNQILQEYEVD